MYYSKKDIAAAKANKYHNRKCDYDGITFDSKKEMQRYIFLKGQEKAGVIEGLKLQVRFTLLPSQYTEEAVQLKRKVTIKKRVKFRSVTYTCDFMYTKVDTGEVVVEDVKASKYLLPKEFALKEKMLYNSHKIEIRKIYSPTDPI